MHTIRYLAIIGVSAAVLVGCSEQRKQEAAKLARELAEKDSLNALSSVPSQASVPAETLKAEETTIDSTRLASAEPLSPPLDSHTLQSTSDSGITPETPVSVAAVATDTSTQPAPDVNAIPEETSHAAPAAMPPHTRDVYTVQIASSGSRAYADSVVNVFKSRGFEPYIAVATVGGKDLYRVRIGKLATPKEASDLRKQLADSFALDPWVDKISE